VASKTCWRRDPRPGSSPRENGGSYWRAEKPLEKFESPLSALRFRNGAKRGPALSQGRNPQLPNTSGTAIGNTHRVGAWASPALTNAATVIGPQPRRYIPQSSEGLRNMDTDNCGKPRAPPRGTADEKHEGQRECHFSITGLLAGGHGDLHFLGDQNVKRFGVRKRGKTLRAKKPGAGPANEKHLSPSGPMRGTQIPRGPHGSNVLSPEERHYSWWIPKHTKSSTSTFGVIGKGKNKRIWNFCRKGEKKGFLAEAQYGRVGPVGGGSKIDTMSWCWPAAKRPGKPVWCVWFVGEKNCQKKKKTVWVSGFSGFSGEWHVDRADIEKKVGSPAKTQGPGRNVVVRRFWVMVFRGGRFDFAVGGSVWRCFLTPFVGKKP